MPDRLQMLMCLCCDDWVGATSHLVELLPDGRRLLWCYADSVRRAVDVSDDARFASA